MLRTFRKVVASALATIGKAAVFNGAARLVINPAADLNVGSQDFTIQMKYNPSHLNGVQRIYQVYSTYQNSGMIGVYIASGVLYAFLAGNDVPDGGSKVAIGVSNNKLIAGKVQDICFERVGNSFQLYVGGAAQNAPAISSIGMPPVHYPNYIGARLYADVGQVIEYMTGTLDEFRMIIGESRWKGAFTPPEKIIGVNDQWWGKTVLALIFDNGMVDLKNHSLTNYGVTQANN